MKILVINGSPKGERSDTMHVTRAFIEGMGETYDVIDSMHVDVKPCLGCYACWTKTPGECVQNTNRHGNMHKAKFYVCPVCGNVIFSAGEGAFSCCGVQLPPLEAEQDEDEHRIGTEVIEGELFVSMVHPMEKTHYISFFALVTSDRAQIVKLYPEQDASARFPVRARGTLYVYCNRHGLFSKRV